MKASQIITQLETALPRLTNYFTENISGKTISRNLNVITVVTKTPHGLRTGDYAIIINTLVKNPILSINKNGKIATANLKWPSDQTLNFNKTVTISGSDNPEYNGSFTLVDVTTPFSIKFDVGFLANPNPTGDIILEENRLVGFNGRHQVTVIDEFTFKYNVEDIPDFFTPFGEFEVRVRPRISGGVSLDRCIASYSKQPQNFLWAYVVLSDMTISRDRHQDSDASSNFSNGDDFRQTMINPFDIYVFTPSTQSISGRQERDLMQEIAIYLYGALLGAKFEVQLVCPGYYQVTAIGHGFEVYNTAYYVHKFSFEILTDITYGDTIGPPISTALRRIDIEFFGENSDNKLSPPLIADVELP